MKNRDISVGVCSAIAGVFAGVVMFTSAHGSFSLAGSTIPLLAIRYDDGMHGAAYQYIKRHVSDVPFFDVQKDEGDDATGTGSTVAPTLCDTVKAVVGDIKTVVTDTIPQDLRFRKYVNPILRALTDAKDQYCNSGVKRVKNVKIDNHCEQYPEGARFTTCKRYEAAGTVYP